MRRCRPLLGTFVEIECDHAEAIDAGFAAIERVHRLMSAHEPDSELSRVNRFAHRASVTVSWETAEVLERAIFWSQSSDGAFDPVHAGCQALCLGFLPRHQDQPAPDPRADWNAVRIAGSTVSLAVPACVDLGGIAKGYAVDRAVAEMLQAGATAGIVNAGGDMRAFGARARRVTVVEPLTRAGLLEVDLSESAIATSAGLPNGADLSFEHLIECCSDWVSVTVQAGNACDADALAKIVCSLGKGALPVLAASGANAFAIRHDRHAEWVKEAARAA